MSAESHSDNMGKLDHLVQFYEDDTLLVETVSHFIGTGLESGHAGIVIATPAHRDSLAERLTVRGLDVAAAHERGQYVPLDAAGTLMRFMVDGWPDERRFAEVIGDVIARAEGRHPGVRAYGEMVALLGVLKKWEVAIRLEQLWNNLRKTHSFSLLCAYPIGEFGREKDGKQFRNICSEHSHIVPAESYMVLGNSDERLRAITELQQKAKALGYESAKRDEAEKALYRREKELTDFFENAVEGIQKIGPDRRILWTNKAQLNLLGHTAEEYVGHDAAEFHVYQEVFEEMWAKLMRRETVSDYPAVLRCKDGSPKHVLIHSNVLWEDGKFHSTRCFIRDITERHRVEEVRNHLAAIVESSDDAILSKDLEGRILSWNQGAERLFGYTAPEVIGKFILLLIPRDRWGEETQILEKLRQGNRIEHFETVRQRKNGSLVEISLTVSPIETLRATS